jgi:hypothetical protein
MTCGGSDENVALGLLMCLAVVVAVTAQQPPTPPAPPPCTDNATLSSFAVSRLRRTSSFCPAASVIVAGSVFRHGGHQPDSRERSHEHTRLPGTGRAGGL